MRSSVLRSHFIQRLIKLDRGIGAPSEVRYRAKNPASIIIDERHSPAHPKESSMMQVRLSYLHLPHLNGRLCRARSHPVLRSMYLALLVPGAEMSRTRALGFEESRKTG